MATVGVKRKFSVPDDVTDHGFEEPVNPVTCFDPTCCPPTLASSPRQVVILMRHGDRTPIPRKIGSLDVSQQSSAWEELLPSAQEQQIIDAIPVLRSDGDGSNSYAVFVGERPWGQLTSQGFMQCQRVGKELRRRYPKVNEIRALSTNFPRTIQSAASVLGGMVELGANPSSDLCVQVRAPPHETLLPNFDGACERFARLRADRMRDVPGPLKAMATKLENRLQTVIGPDPMRSGNILDFKPFCVHAGKVEPVKGIDWELVNLTEEYLASLEAHVYEDPELVRLASGRLVREVVDALREQGHRITLLLAHDNMLTAFLVAIGAYKQQWPLYASNVTLETAEFSGQLKVRILINDEVRMDWMEWSAAEKSLCAHAMSPQQYKSACEAGTEQLK